MSTSFFNFRYLRAAVVAFVVVYIIVWVSDAVGSLWGGLIASLPLSIPLIVFILDEQIPGYALALGIGGFAYVFAIFALIYFYNYMHTGKYQSIGLAVLIWVVIAIPIFYYFWKNPPSYIKDDKDDKDDKDGKDGKDDNKDNKNENNENNDNKDNN